MSGSRLVTRHPALAAQPAATVRDERFESGPIGLPQVLLGSACTTAFIILAWWAQGRSFILFHSVTEVFCVVIAATSFIVAWNARRFHGSGWLLLIGTALLAVGVLDLFHLLAYKGMNIFPGFPGANAATELWVGSRYLFAGSLLVAALLVPGSPSTSVRELGGRADRRRMAGFAIALLIVYGSITVLLLMSVFWWNAFPDCFVEGVGLTPFKKISEFVISGILLISAILFWQRRERLDNHFLQLLLAGIAVAILTQLCFTLYQDVFGLVSWTGHLLKVGSYALLYGAIVVTGMQRPYALLFRNLKEREHELLDAKTRAEAASQAKDQFLAVLSHELRNPLNPVLAHVSALQTRTDLPPDVLEEMTIIRRNVELEARLIDDLLDLTRIAKGKLALSPTSVDVHALVRQALDICNDEVMAKRLTVDVHLRATRHTVEADAARLLQVFWNVFKNAVKFSSVGGRVLVQSDSFGLGEEIVFRLRVIDEGIGIQPAQLDRIFDAFRQGDDSVTHRFGGLGLGLSISRTLIELHGGTIRADSAGLGEGAQFVVEMPASSRIVPLTDDSPVASDLVGQSYQEKPVTKSLRLLVVEDHIDTARVMGRLLKGLGHEVSVAHNVADGLVAAEGETFDLVLSDLGLPDGSGLDLMRQLRDRHQLRGICLSGYGMEEDLQRSHAAGFMCHLTKPITFEALCNAITTATADDAKAEAGDHGPTIASPWRKSTT